MCKDGFAAADAVAIAILDIVPHPRFLTYVGDGRTDASGGGS